jgi:hypothetical protein
MVPVLSLTNSVTPSQAIPLTSILILPSNLSIIIIIIVIITFIVCPKII